MRQVRTHYKKWSDLSLLTRYAYGDRTRRVVAAVRKYHRELQRQQRQQRTQAVERLIWRGGP